MQGRRHAVSKLRTKDRMQKSIWDVVLPKYIDQGQVTGQKSEEFWIDVGTHERLNLLNSAYNGDQ